MKARKKRCTKARPRCKLYIDDNSLQVFDFNGDYSDDYDNENEKFMIVNSEIEIDRQLVDRVQKEIREIKEGMNKDQKECSAPENEDQNMEEEEEFHEIKETALSINIEKNALEIADIRQNNEIKEEINNFNNNSEIENHFNESKEEKEEIESTSFNNETKEEKQEQVNDVNQNNESNEDNQEQVDNTNQNNEGNEENQEQINNTNQNNESNEENQEQVDNTNQNNEGNEENQEQINNTNQDNEVQEERKLIYKDPEEEPFSSNTSFPHVSTNIEILSPFYKNDSIMPTMMPCFPDPVNYNSYEQYLQASKQWYSDMCKSANNFVFPILPTLFYRRSHPIDEEIYLPVSDTNPKLRKTPNPIDYYNRLYIQHIAIEGKNVDENIRMPKRMAGTFFPVKHALNVNNMWNGQLFYPPPEPECFDTYEEFEASYINWYQHTSKFDNFPYHPSEFSPKYIKLRTSTQFEPTVVQGKYNPIQDECDNQCKDDLLSEDSLSSLISFKYVFYIKECFSDDMFVKLLEDHEIPNIYSQKLNEYIQQLKLTGSFDREERIMNQNISNAIIAKSFTFNSNNIFNLPTSNKKILAKKFMFYLSQTLISKSYSYFYGIFKNMDSCFNLDTSYFSVYLTKNINIFNQIAYYINNFSKVPKRHFYTLISRSLSKLNSDLSGDLEVFFQALVHFHLIRIISESIQCFNKKSCDFHLMYEQAYNFVAKFSETSVPLMISSLNSNNAIIYVTIILLVLDSNFNVMKNFIKSFKKNIFYFFNQISTVSKSSFIYLEEYILYYIDNIEFLFPYYIDFLENIKLLDFEKLSPLMLSFLSQFISIYPPKIKIKSKSYLITILNMLIEYETNEKIYHFIYLFSLYFNQIQKISKKKGTTIIQKFGKFLLSIKTPSKYLLKAYRAILLNSSFKHILSTEKEWLIPITRFMCESNSLIQKESFKAFRKLFFANSTLLMKLCKNPVARTNIVKGIHIIQKESAIEIIKLITTISLKLVEADLPKSLEQKNQSGFIFLLSNVPYDLIEFAQLFIESSFNLYSYLTTIKAECMKNKKTEWILNLFRKTLNERTAVKQLFSGNYNKQMERTVNKN